MTDNAETAHVKALIDGLYTGQERISRLEINERMLAADVSADLMGYFDRLPDGDYEQEELVETINQMIAERGEQDDLGQIPEL
jgi:hypothetical protein